MIMATDLPPDSATSPAGAGCWIDTVAITVVAVIALSACLRWTGIDKIHVNGINDQSGYIAAARSLADTGRITGHKIYPSFLLQQTSKSVFYMPGFYVCLAASYKLLGYGVFQSLLPNLMAFVVAAICTYLIGRRLYHRSVGLLAAGLFIFYPPNLFFACTAMSEMCITAAAVGAMCVFVYLSPRARLLVGPMLLVIPFLFRESNAFVVIPMAALIWAGATRRRRFVTTSAFLVAAVVVLGIVDVSPLAAGRPSFIKAAVFNDSPAAAFSDAFALEHVHPHTADWIHALGGQCWINARLCVVRVFTDHSSYQMPSMLPLLLAIPIGLLWGIEKRNAFAIGSALLVACAIGFICVFNGVREEKSLRLAMFVAPWVAILAAQMWMALAAFISRKTTRMPGSVIPAIAVIALACVAFPTVRTAVQFFRRYDGFDRATTSIVELLHHDNQTLLVGPPGLCMPYCHVHYPVLYSFVPANDRTFELLRNRYAIGTAIIDSTSTVTGNELAKAGLKLHHHITYAGATVAVYQRPANEAVAAKWPVADEIIPSAFLHLPATPVATPPKKRR